MESKDGIFYVKRTQRDYSLSFKLGVVGEVERGELSPTDAARKYGIQGDSTIKRWLRKFGTFDQDHVIPNCMVKSPQQRIRELELENMRLKQQYKLLEQQAQQAIDKAGVLDILVDIAEKEYRIPLRKKACPEQSQVTSKGKK